MPEGMSREDPCVISAVIKCADVCAADAAAHIPDDDIPVSAGRYWHFFNCFIFNSKVNTGNSQNKYAPFY